jgi:hypothetical protein
MIDHRTVIPEASSINAAGVVHLGVREANMLVRILLSAALVAGSANPVIAGSYRSRPPGASLQCFTGVINHYSAGNDVGTFDLTLGGKTMTFYIGLPMTMNGRAVIGCQDSECADWPSEIAEGKSVVTATCWPDTVFEPGTTNFFCDEIDSAPSRQDPGPQEYPKM